MEYDKNSFFEVLINYHSQFEVAIKIGLSIKTNFQDKKIEKILVLGMGGSAIGGELIKSVLYGYKALNNIVFHVNKDYYIPDWVDDKTLVIASSYSGNTEETLEAFEKASKNTQMLACLTSGGELLKIAENKKIDLLAMPTGFQPRCALGYSFTIMLIYILQLNIIDKESASIILNDIQSLPDFIQNKAHEYRNRQISKAKDLATSLIGKLPLFYSSEKILASVNARCRGQIHENTKTMTFGGILPEMNHNEINSFKNPNFLQENLFYIFIKDQSDHPRIQKRIDVMVDILDIGNNSIILNSNENCLLHRVFDILYFVDWVSYYLAEAYDEDPISIPLISRLKIELNN